MRKTSFILIIAILLLGGCKPKSQSSLEIKTDSSKSNNGFKMPDLGDIKNNPNTPNNQNNSNNYNNSNNSGWSKTYRDKSVQDCVTKASEKMSESEAFSYCNCMVAKVEAKYPNENNVESRLTSSDIESMKNGCLSNSNQTNPSNDNSNKSNNYNSGSWSMADQREFMDNCTPGASKSLGTSVATDYCDCMMKKLMREYPNSKDVGDVSSAHMSELANGCLGR
jgi:hypothetical protein